MLTTSIHTGVLITLSTNENAKVKKAIPTVSNKIYYTARARITTLFQVPEMEFYWISGRSRACAEYLNQHAAFQNG